MISLKVFSWNMFGETEEYHKNLSQGSWDSSCGFKQAPCENEARTVPLYQPIWSEFLLCFFVDIYIMIMLSSIRSSWCYRYHKIESIHYYRFFLNIHL